MKKIIIALIVILLASHKVNAQWERCVNGFPGYSTYSIVFKGQKIFAGTDQGGVFISNDNGQNWIAKNKGLKKEDSYNFTVYNLAVSGSKIFAGTHNGVYFSTDEGENWVKDSDSNPFRDRIVWQFLTRGKNLYALVTGWPFCEIYLSTNEGDSWKKISSETMEFGITGIAVNDSYLYSAGNSGIRMTGYQDTSWTNITKDLPYNVNYSITLKDTAILVGIDRWGYAKYYPSGILRSVDKGKSWVQVNNGLADTNIVSLFATDSLIIAGTYYQNVFISTNMGNSWVKADSGMPLRTRLNCIAVKDSLIFAGTSLGIYVSKDNCKSWTPMNNGIVLKPKISSMATFAQLTIISAYGRIYTSSDYGTNWLLNNHFYSEKDISSLAAINNYWIVGTNGDGVLISSDLGQSWEKANKGLSDSAITCLATIGNNILAGTQNGLFLTTNLGENWVAVNNGLTGKYFRYLVTNGQYVYTVGENSRIFMSKDQGESWSCISDNSLIKDLTSFSVVNNLIFACSGKDGLFTSTDNGQSWDNKVYMHFYKNMVAYGNLIFAGNDKGVFYSRDNGLKWDSLNQGLPEGNRYISELSINGPYIFAATSNEGLFRAKISDLLTGVEDNTHSDTGINIFPNPVSDLLTIQSKSLSGTIIITDYLGQEVYRSDISDSEQINIPFSNCQAGTYFIKIASPDGKIQISKFIKL